MIVRIQLKSSQQEAAPEPEVVPEPEPVDEVVTWREMAGGLATLLSPAAAMCFALGFWRLGQDMGFARNFFITEGPLSHWQVWIAGATVLLATSQWLNRRARPDDDEPATN